jgi:Pyruvate/2-oxoacid:ferredoxin oxidoreductase delta subunit
MFSETRELQVSVVFIFFNLLQVKLQRSHVTPHYYCKLGSICVTACPKPSKRMLDPLRES